MCVIDTYLDSSVVNSLNVKRLNNEGIRMDRQFETNRLK
jgi:hypothetical protein